MSTVIYYFSSTGNSLYVARELQKIIPDTELRSIADALHENTPTVNAERIGFVFPMHYFGLPMQVERFLEKLTIMESPYIFAVVTCGVPYWGRPFIDMEKILSTKNCRVYGKWYLRLVSNYIPYRDIAADWRISVRAWLAKRKIKKIAESVNNMDNHDTWQILRKICADYHERWKESQSQIDDNFQCNKEKCTACRLCERICPQENITCQDGYPIWHHDCVECLGCLHICPVQAIDYGEITKGRKRYRHKSVKPVDLLHTLRN